MIEIFILLNFGVLIGVLSLLIFAIYKNKIKRLYYGATHRGYFVAHLLVPTGSTWFEKEVKVLPISSRWVSSDDEEYNFDPEKVIWKSTGVWGIPEIHVYYEKGNAMPLEFFGKKDSKEILKSAKINRLVDRVEEKLVVKALRAQSKGVSMRIFLYILIAIVAIVAVYILLPYFLPQPSLPPVPPR